jgi:hypothetical protein
MIEREMGYRGSKSDILITLVKCFFLFLVIITLISLADLRPMGN